MDGQPRVIKVAKAPKQPAKQSTNSSLDMLAELCFYYPAYTLAAARRLPAPHVSRLLRRARQLEARRYLNLVEIVTAPHTEKGKGVKELTDKYRQIVENG